MVAAKGGTMLFDFFDDLNWLAVIVATLAYNVIGFAVMGIILGAWT